MVKWCCAAGVPAGKHRLKWESTSSAVCLILRIRWLLHLMPQPAVVNSDITPSTSNPTSCLAGVLSIIYFSWKKLNMFWACVPGNTLSRGYLVRNHPGEARYSASWAEFYFRGETGCLVLFHFCRDYMHVEWIWKLTSLFHKSRFVRLQLNNAETFIACREWSGDSFIYPGVITISF